MRVYRLDTEKESDLQKRFAHDRVDSPLFKAVEKIFDDFMDANGERACGGDLRAMYESEDAIYEKAGAIRGAIEQVFEVIDEYDLKYIDLTDSRLDLICAFV